MLAEAAMAHQVKRFIYTGTIDSHDSASTSNVIDSDTPLDARMTHRNLYARSKAACEALLQQMHREGGLPLVVLRPGIVVGAGNPPAHWGVGMFHSDTRAQLWGDGTTKLPLVLVDDVAEGLALGMTTPGIEGQTFLLTDEPLLSAKEYVQKAGAAWPVKITVHRIPAWKHFGEDVVERAIKNIIRHPNRKMPSFRPTGTAAPTVRATTAKRNRCWAGSQQARETASCATASLRRWTASTADVSPRAS